MIQRRVFPSGKSGSRSLVLQLIITITIIRYYYCCIYGRRTDTLLAMLSTQTELGHATIDRTKYHMHERTFGATNHKGGGLRDVRGGRFERRKSPFAEINLVGKTGGTKSYGLQI